MLKRPWSDSLDLVSELKNLEKSVSDIPDELLKVFLVSKRVHGA